MNKNSNYKLLRKLTLICTCISNTTIISCNQKLRNIPNIEEDDNDKPIEQDYTQAGNSSIVKNDDIIPQIIQIDNFSDHSIAL